MPIYLFRELKIHFRTDGRGPPVILLHSAGMGASQWRRVSDALAPSHEVLAPNLRGYGRTSQYDSRQAGDGGAPAPSDRLEAELAVVAGMVERAGQPVHLVGHSLGALIAARYAHQSPAAVRRLTLIEPVIVGALHDAEAAAALDEIGTMIARFQASIARDDTVGAMRAFTEYWSGAGAWDDIPAAARLPFFARAKKMAEDVDLAWRDRTGAATLGAIRCPALVVSAEQTTPAAREMAGIVADGLHDATWCTVPGAGHMLPVTHPVETAGIVRAFEAG